MGTSVPCGWGSLKQMLMRFLRYFQQFRTALRTAETFILVVDYFRIALNAGSPNGRFTFGCRPIIHLKGAAASDGIYEPANCISLV